MIHKISIYGWIFTQEKFAELFGITLSPDDCETLEEQLEDLQKTIGTFYVGNVCEVPNQDLTKQTYYISISGEIPRDDSLYKTDGFDVIRMPPLPTGLPKGLPEPRLHFLINIV